MKRILVISGSRADYGLLEFPVKVLSESFEVEFEQLHAEWPEQAFVQAQIRLEDSKPDCLLILGDRWEILQAAIAAHLQRIPIAHIAGGDVTLGSYDDAMRDCISRLATYHFTTSSEAWGNVQPFVNCSADVHLVGNIAMDYILHGDWRRDSPYDEPYAVVSYQAETIDKQPDRIDWNKPLVGLHHCMQAALGPNMRQTVVIYPNHDAGSAAIREQLDSYKRFKYPIIYLESMPRSDFLNLIANCEELIGNSSSLLYEAPALGVKTRLIGKRQEGRVIPTGDGKASERIREVLCQCL